MAGFNPDEIKNISEKIKEIDSKVRGMTMDKRMSDRGYVGHIGDELVFSDEAKRGFDELNQKAQTFEEIQKKIAALEKKKVVYQEMYKKNQDAEAKKEAAKLQREINKLNNESYKVSFEHHKLDLQQKELLEKINKELEYQNKKLKEGVTLHERMDHFLNKHVMNVAKFKNGVSELKAGLNILKGIGVDFTASWRELDQSAQNYGRHIGMSAEQTNKMRRQMLDVSNSLNLGGRYDVNAKELIEMRDKYQSQVGRQLSFDKNDLETFAASKSLVGEENTIKYSAGLERLGFNPQEAGNVIGKLFKDATAKGLAFSKTSQLFVDNLKLAQSYTFRNGVEGLKSMAEKAASINMNMSEVARFADKVSTVEGAMQTAASLSVLGGDFAAYGDPMRMLYEGLNDMEGLQDRMMGMFQNMATFDEKTGQMSVSAYNRMRIKEASQSMGLNYNDTMDMVFAEGKRKHLEGQLGGGLDKETRDMLLNRASMDENGKGYIELNGEKKYFNEIKGKDDPMVQSLKKIGESQSDNIKSIAASMLSLNERVEGIKKAADDKINSMIDSAMQSTKNIVTWLSDYAGIFAIIKTAVTAIAAVVAGGMAVNSIRNMWGARGGSGGVNLSTGGGYGGGIGFNGGAMKNANMGMYNGAKGNWTYRGQAVTNPETIARIEKNIANGNIKEGGAYKFIAANSANAAPKAPSRMARFGNFMGGGGAMLLGAGANIAGGYLQNSSMDSMMNGDYDDAVTKSTLGGALSYAGTGAMMGAMISPLGALIGAGVGALAGGLMSYSDSKKRAEAEKHAKELEGFYKRIKQERGYDLRGTDYTYNELKDLADRGKEAVPSMFDKFMRNEGYSSIDDVPEFMWGGRVPGTSYHGDKVMARMNSGEMVINNRDIANGDNAEFATSMNSGATFMKVRGNQMNSLKVSPSGTGVSSIGSTSISLSPIDVSGTIKLDLGGYSRDIDSQQLMGNDYFISMLTERIAKELNKQEHHGYEKNEMYYKYG